LSFRAAEGPPQAEKSKKTKEKKNKKEKKVKNQRFLRGILKMGWLVCNWV